MEQISLHTNSFQLLSLISGVILRMCATQPCVFGCSSTGTPATEVLRGRLGVLRGVAAQVGPTTVLGLDGFQASDHD